jgi:hypothetical protein
MSDDLSNYRNLDFLVGIDAADLKRQFDNIRLPYKIISIYAQGTRHYAWVLLSAPIRKKKVELKSIKQEIE